MMDSEERAHVGRGRLVHFGTGGLTHMLIKLGYSLIWSNSMGYSLTPVMGLNASFGMRLSDVFQVNRSTSPLLDLEEESGDSTSPLTDHNDASQYARHAVVWRSPANYSLIAPGGTETALEWLDFSWPKMLWRRSSPSRKVLTAGSPTRSVFNPTSRRALRKTLQLLVPHDDVFDTARRWVNETRGSSNCFVGVHIRFSDLRDDPGLALKDTIEILDRDAVDRVYLSTDSLETRRFFQRQLQFERPDVKLTSRSDLYEEVNRDSTRGLHRVDLGYRQAKLQQVKEALAEAVVLATADYLVASRVSSFSKILVPAFRSQYGLTHRRIG